MAELDERKSGTSSMTDHNLGDPAEAFIRAALGARVRVEQLASLRIATVADLADSRWFRIAGHPSGHPALRNRADRSRSASSFRAVAPLAIRGLDGATAANLAKLGLKAIGDLADWVPYKAARALADQEAEEIGFPSTLLVYGRIVTERGEPAQEVTLTFHGDEFGRPNKFGTATTDADGYYLAPSIPGNANLRVTTDVAGKEEDLLRTKYSLREDLELNLAVPRGPGTVKSELSWVQDAIDEVAKGADLKSATTRDLDFLAARTGLDPQIIRMRFEAAHLGHKTKLDEEIVYGLLRSGLAASAEALARLTDSEVEERLAAAVQANVISLGAAALKAAPSQVSKFSGRYYAATATLPLSATKYTNLAQQVLPAGDSSKFLELARTVAPGKLWGEAKSKLGLSDTTLGALKAQARLGLLTDNNFALAGALGAAGVDVHDVGTLVSARLYEAQSWKPLILDGQTAEQAAKGIPASIDEYKTGNGMADPDARVDAYARELARRVRKALPDEVLQDRIGRRQFKIGAREVTPGVDGLISALRKEPGFSLGASRKGAPQLNTALGRLRRTALNTTAFDQKAADLKALQRVRQISPDTRTMQLVLKKGFTSAHQIGSTPYAVFMGLFANEFISGAAVPLLVQWAYTAARQVESRTWNFFGEVTNVNTGPGLAVLSGTGGNTEATTAIHEQYPTIEQLFGSTDYCACEHCRSLLSPAAYFVELLQFLEPDPVGAEAPIWTDFLLKWKGAHGADYMDGWAPAAMARTPYDALIEKRPDLPHLQLTCENTNTLMPYIDVVNEVLETIVAGDSLGDLRNDTGERTSEELVTEPQYIIVKAYEKLQKEAALMPMPFDLFSETVRQFLSAQGVAHSDLLELIREPTNSLDGTSGGQPTPRDVALSRLGLSRIQHETVAKAKWWELYGYADTASAEGALKSAKTLSRRLGVSYQELNQLVQTKWVNPGSARLEVARRLGIGIDSAFAWSTVGDRTIDARARAEGIDVARAKASLPKARDLLVVRDNTTLCSWETMEYSRADGADASPADFYRLNLFVRLWRHLGWSMHEVDVALDTFVTASVDRTDVAALKQRLPTIYIYLARVVELEELLALDNGDREALLGMWQTEIFTGRNSAFRSRFLSKSVLDLEPSFDSAIGDFFDPPKKIDDVREALCTALGTSDDDLGRLLERIWRNRMSTLTVDVAAALLKRVDFARFCRLSIADLILFEDVFGPDLSPFRSLKNGDLDLIDEDATQQPLDFVRELIRVRDRGLSAEELAFFLDPKSVLSSRGLARMADLDIEYFAFARELRTALRGVDNLVADAWTPELLTTALGPILNQADVERLIALWSAVDGQGAGPGWSASQHSATAFLETPAGITVSDDSAAATWTARYNGILNHAELVSLRARNAGKSATLGLIDGLEAERIAWFQGIKPLGLSYDDLFGSDRRLRHNALNQFVAETRRLRQNALATTMSLFTGWNPTEINQVLSWFEIERLSPKTIDLSASGTSDSLQLYFDVPVAGQYRIEEEGGARTRVWLEHSKAPILDTSVDDPSVLLEVGRTYRLESEQPGRMLKVFVEGYTLGREGVGAFRTTAWTAKSVREAQSEYLRIARLVMLQEQLGLTPREVIHVLNNFSDFGGLKLAELPVDASATVKYAELRPLLLYSQLAGDVGHDVLIDLAEAGQRAFAAAGGHEGMVSDEVARLLGTLLDVPPAQVEAAFESQQVEAVGNASTPETVTVEAVRRPEAVWGVLRHIRFATKLGGSLATWAKTPDDGVALKAKSSLRAKHGASWNRLAQPVFDVLRQKKRDALVAYLLHEKDLQRPEDLFSALLLDPLMEPTVHTSRLLAATASVQTFIERCLLNLESRVHPTAIFLADQWSWMKRYRMWEANRKTWLYPENWLEPEFRDDKTHLFRQLEGALLEDDITEERAESLMFNYLRGLEKIARLDIVTTYRHERGTGQAPVLHVLGRTYGTPHEYFYRRYESSGWTAWEPVDAEIEGDHIVLLMWRGQPHIFWLRFLDTASVSNGAATVEVDASVEPPERQVDISMRWSHQTEGRWSAPRGSDGSPHWENVGLDPFDPASVGVSGFVNGRFVNIHLDIEGRQRLTFELRAPFAELGSQDEGLVLNRYLGRGALLPPTRSTRHGTRHQAEANAALEVGVRRNGDYDAYEALPIIQGDSAFSVVPPGNFETVQQPMPRYAAALLPFFFQDRDRTFFITSEIEERTFLQVEGWVLGPPEIPKIRELWEIFESPWSDPLINLDPDAVYGVDTQIRDRLGRRPGLRRR